MTKDEASKKILEDFSRHELLPRVNSSSLKYNDNMGKGGPADVVADYVSRLGGNKVIRKILIANNGIAAVKAIRSIRRWAYETFANEREIQFVVMATPDDIRVNAEYIRLADEFVEVPGGNNNNNYANVSLIVDIAEQCECDAVWAGWGHASENPKLPDTLANTKTQIAFIGPNGEAMRALGDKIGSTLIAQSANVSTMPWSGDGLTVDYQNEGIPDDLYRRACVTTPEEAAREAERIGYPVMIKASEGGGGKGIRKATSSDQVPALLRAVQGEVPGSPVFIMKLCAASRHLEVQVLADAYGQAIALFGRDCSVQRRHQKIIEEGPVVAAPEDTWREMEKAAVRLAKTVGYKSLGTVEYLYKAGMYYFLELNPRLQVEHPVTEWITDVNLPAAQLNVAMGIPLNRIPSIRRLYGEEPFADTPIDFDNRMPLHPKGHVIASRITAENPDEGFQPTSGAIREVNFRSTPNVWGYFSVLGSGGVHEFSDSQFGHLFAWGENREYARKNLVCALKELEIHGEIRTTVEFLIKMLETTDYVENSIDTTWLDGLIAQKMTAEKPEKLLAVACGALWRAWSLSKAKQKELLAYLERGQNIPKQLSLISFHIDLIYDDDKFSIHVSRASPYRYSLHLNNSSVQAEVRQLSDGGLLILLDGKSHVTYAKEEVGGLRLVLDSKTVLFPNEYDPTQLRAQMTGKLVRYLVEDGQHVKAGGSYAEIEVMKMYMPLITPESGRIRHKKAEGSVLEAGDLIALLDLDDPTKVRRAAAFVGQLPPMRPPRVLGDRVHQIARNSLSCIKAIMAGYDNRPEALTDLVTCLTDPELPLLEFNEILAVISSRCPPAVFEPIDAIVKKYRAAVEDAKKAGAGAAPVELDTLAVSKILEDYTPKLTVKTERDAFVALTQPLRDLVKAYSNGLQGHLVDVLASIMKEYIDVELLFNQGRGEEEAIDDLRDTYKNEMNKLVDVLMSHRQLQRKNKVILGILEYISVNGLVHPLERILHDVANFTARQHSEVALRARQILISYQTPSFQQRTKTLEAVLQAANQETEVAKRRDALRPIVTQSEGVFDVLIPIFQAEDQSIADTALEAYVMRAYQAYELVSLEVKTGPQFSRAVWDYSFQGAAAGNVGTRLGRMVVFDSSDNLTSLQQRAPIRKGMLVSFTGLDELTAHFPQVLELYAEHVDRGSLKYSNAVNVLDVALIWDKTLMPTEQVFVDTFTQFLKPFSTSLRKCGLKMVTFLVVRPSEYPGCFTFRERNGYEEDLTYRHIVPPMAYELELERLSNFNIQQYPSSNRNVHVYYAEEKPVPRARNTRAIEGGESESPAEADRRFFVRAVLRQARIFTGTEAQVSIPDAERMFVEALKMLEMAMVDARFKKTEHNHVFLNIIPEIIIDSNTVDDAIKRIYMRYAQKLLKLRIAQVELKVQVKPSPNAKMIQMRFVASNPTGHVLRVDGYLEVKDPITGATTLTAIGEEYPGQLQSMQAQAPYPVLSYIQRKRIQAHLIGTSYAYDFIELFEKALQEVWKHHTQERLMTGYRRKKMPTKLLEAVELVLNGQNELDEVKRAPGQNDIGMVAWRVTLYTPEYPDHGGRQIILIANDITFMSGSFGPKEDMLFYKASELSRKEGLPRIYLAANSGARIGLAAEIKDVFRVEWNDPQLPDRGFKYLYVTPADYRRLSEKGSMNAELVEVCGPDGQVVEQRYKVTDIIGAVHGLGVENLSGSGMIAGETSHAYEDVFTLSLVTSRTVGIGAYLVRLGQRVIQNKGPGPIILTGYSALNKVLGRDVYTSNLQIGGTKIMFANGVSHLTVKDDLEGVIQVLNWLSFVPDRKGAALPVIEAVDPISRPISFLPTKTPYDSRHMLAGVTDSSGHWQSGFFDKGSMIETLAGWAKTVVTGRGRLGGIPVGFIAVETRSVEQVTPADPANPMSTEAVVQQAGQVWFPDSAYKTSQAIADMSREGLPLFIFANWRGFSGGMRDMFDEILKFGSYIVDNLRTYRQPVFVYIPPGGELRGGAWVVVDSLINPEMIEMYADTDARGGVLEPQGIVEIKFRRRDLVVTMHRLDQKLMELNAQLKSETMEEKKRDLKKAIESREEKLLNVYNQIAVQFADLHDTPGRMKAKNVIRAVVPWAQAREYFYWRLRRRLAEEAIRSQISRARPGLSYVETTQLLVRWLQQYEEIEGPSTTGGSPPLSPARGYRTPSPALVSDQKFPVVQERDPWANDRLVIQWLEEDEINITRRIKSLRQMHISDQIHKLGREDTDAVLSGVFLVLQSIEDPHKREQLIEQLIQFAAPMPGKGHGNHRGPPSP